MSTPSSIRVLLLGATGLVGQQALRQLLARDDVAEVRALVRNLITDGINSAHYDMRFVKPLDETLLHEVFSKYSKVITVEDGAISGGFGSAVLEFMAAHGYHAQVSMLGIPDRLVEHGTLKELHRECGFDAEGIENMAREMMKEQVTVNQIQ